MQWPAAPNRYGKRERDLLDEALSRGNLFYAQADGLVDRMLAKMRAVTGRRYAVASSSGTAAIHAAIAAAGVEPGAEVVLPPITDMGTAIGILMQNAVPVFSDVDPSSYNLTAATVEAVITPRTQAVIAVHLAGTPCDMLPLAALCKSRGIALIEDCAQAWGAQYAGKPVGGVGQSACFSFNEFKHLSCGDGGVIVTDDERVYHAALNFTDKHYDRARNGSQRMARLGMNYRMTELQGAVALAQLERLDAVAAHRHRIGGALDKALSAIAGIRPQAVPRGGASAYWFNMFRTDFQVLNLTRNEVVRRLNGMGVPATPGYLPRPLCHEPVFRDRAFFPGGAWPAAQISGHTPDYSADPCPVAAAILNDAVLIRLHEGVADEHVRELCHAVYQVVDKKPA